MLTVILVIHLLIAIALVILILLQPSEGGGIGLGSAGGGGAGGGGFGGMMTGRGTANFMTRATAVLAACFMATSIGLTMLSGGGEERSILDDLPAAGAPAAPGPDGQPAAPEEGEPAPATPEVPLD